MFHFFISFCCHCYCRTLKTHATQSVSAVQYQESGYVCIDSLLSESHFGMLPTFFVEMNDVQESFECSLQSICLLWDSGFSGLKQVAYVCVLVAYFYACMYTPACPIETISLFPTATILWVLSFCIHALDIAHPIMPRRNAPRNSAVMRQRSNHSNNKLSHHLVGTLMSHWWLLFTQAFYSGCSLFCADFTALRKAYYLILLC